MDKLLLRVALVVAVLAAALLLAGRLGFLSGRAPADLGVTNGRLKPPSNTPNSVSSQAGLWPGHPQRDRARIEPLALRADRGEPIARLQAFVAAMPGARVVSVRGDYLYAQFTTPLLRFVDDVEFWLDPAAGVVQVRSASRLGHGDRGLNRERIEAIRAGWGG
jgi:uncharacterized protein (DUF1499 family)